MGRPAKVVATKGTTTAKKKERLAVEDSLVNGTEKLVPPEYLTEHQGELFYYIIDELENSNVLGNLDLFIITQASISIDRLQTAEQQINENPSLILDQKFRSAREMYSKEFLRCCNELCLSPQSRAKISIAVTNKKEDNPLIGLMADDD